MAESYSRNDLGPLTTIFTPAASCGEDLALHVLQLLQDTRTAVYGYWGSTIECATLLHADYEDNSLTSETYMAADGCFPTPYVTMKRTGRRTSVGPHTTGVGFFSPGYECPSGFTTACGFASGDPSPTEGISYLVPMLRSGESVAVCCPSGQTCTLDTYGPLLGCAGDAFRPTTTMSGIKNLNSGDCPISTTSTTVTTDLEGGVKADAILLVRQVSGKDKPPEKTGGSGSPGSDGNDGSPSDSSSGLSTKAKIAVGVAVPVGALLLIGLVVTLVLLARRRRKNRATAAAAAAQQHRQEPPYNGQVNEADGTGVASPRHELADEKPEPHMLDSGPGATPAAELAGVKGTSNEPSELQDLRAEEQALEQQLARIRERQRAQQRGQPPVELP